jgi:hypothetical protein
MLFNQKKAILIYSRYRSGNYSACCLYQRQQRK